MLLIKEILPYYIQAIEKYITTNKNRSIIRNIQPDAVKLAAAKRESAEKFVIALKEMLPKDSVGNDQPDRKLSHSVPRTSPRFSDAPASGSPYSISSESILRSNTLNDTRISLDNGADDIDKVFSAEKNKISMARENIVPEHAKGSYDHLLTIICTHIEKTLLADDRILESSVANKNKDYENLLLFIATYKCLLAFDKELYYFSEPFPFLANKYDYCFKSGYFYTSNAVRDDVRKQLDLIADNIFAWEPDAEPEIKILAGFKMVEEQITKMIYIAPEFLEKINDSCQKIPGYNEPETECMVRPYMLDFQYMHNNKENIPVTSSSTYGNNVFTPLFISKNSSAASSAAASPINPMAQKTYLPTLTKHYSPLILPTPSP